jgi:hypothetical protein
MNIFVLFMNSPTGRVKAASKFIYSSGLFKHELTENCKQCWTDFSR